MNSTHNVLYTSDVYKNTITIKWFTFSEYDHWYFVFIVITKVEFLKQ